MPFCLAASLPRCLAVFSVFCICVQRAAVFLRNLSAQFVLLEYPVKIIFPILPMMIMQL
jgi:hypothetical protein